MHSELLSLRQSHLLSPRRYRLSMQTVGERLKQARIAAGYDSAAAAAEAFGWHKQNVRDHEADRRGVSPDQADRYARAYRTGPAWILFGRGSPDDAGPATSATEIRLPIRYEVAASGFLERDELPQRPYGFHTVPSVAPYSGAPQWLERVVSDSMDLLLPVGSLVHVVDTIALEYEPRHGDVVIVERSRAQGALVERTIKQVALTPTGPELWPRSHNPRHQQAIALHDGDDRSDDVTVQIVGKVIRSYMFFEPEAEEPEVA